MASDLPEQHRSSYAMALCLVTYIDDPKRVRRAVMENWSEAPDLRTIIDMRKRHLLRKQKPAAEPFKPYEGYRPDEVAQSLEATNALFLDRLKAERQRSYEAAKCCIPATTPARVNRAWNRIIEHNKERAA